MESFTRRVETDDDDESETMGFSVISSDNGFISSSDELRSEVSSNNVPDEGVLSADSTERTSPSPKRLAMIEGPEILKRLNVFEEVEHGGRVAFECQCKAHPMPVYKWYKDDAELVESDRMRIEDLLETDGTLRLIINNVRKSDEGAYRCKLENQEGVAASTGYLSVTGNSSSPNAVSTPPLLRAITEESNVSQDSDEGASSSSSTTLEKILTGEYDVSTLPYSQYLELLKDSHAPNPNTETIPGPSTTEKNGGNRTPTDDTPHADDVKNLCTDFAYVAPSTVTGDDDVNDFEDRTVAMATNEVEIDAEDFVNKQKSEVIFGTPLHSESKTVFVMEGSRSEVPSDEVETEFSRNSEEKSAEKGEKSVRGLNLEGAVYGDFARAEGFEVDMEFDSRIGEASTQLDSAGDFREGLDESRLKETVIAGRIGMPSDWEFAHYTAEADEAEDALNCVPDEPNATPQLPVETIGSKFEEEEAAGLEAEMGVSTLASESSLPTTEGVLMGVSHIRDALFGGDVQGTGDGEKIVDEKKEEAIVVHENSDEPFASSFLVEKSTSLASEGNIARNDDAGVSEGSLPTSSDQKILTEEFIKLEATEETIKDDKPEFTPEREGVAKWMPDMTSVANVVSGVSTLVNWNANATIPEGVNVQTHEPEVIGSSADEPIKTTDQVPGFHFADLMPDLTSSTAAISDWIPDVSISSYLPHLSAETLLGEGKAAGVEEVAVVDETEQEPRSVIDWCVDWFRYPSIFYVLLVLTMTLVASATQMNPAMVVLVVALCSLVGFRLLPVHGLQHK